MAFAGAGISNEMLKWILKLFEMDEGQVLEIERIEAESRAKATWPKADSSVSRAKQETENAKPQDQ